MTTNQPDPGTDSKVEDWFGQSVQRDAELADRIAETTDSDEEAEAAFEDAATGQDEQARRHGDHIDPEQGESAYRDD